MTVAALRRCRMRALRGDGLRLRPLSRRDRRWYARLYRDPQVMTWIAPPLDAARARRSAELACTGRGDTVYRVIEVDARRGRAGLVGWRRQRGDLELGVIVLPRWQGLRLATRALRRLGAWAWRQPDVERLVIAHRAGHATMAAVARRLGFHAEPNVVDPSMCRWLLHRADVSTQAMAR